MVDWRAMVAAGWTVGLIWFSKKQKPEVVRTTARTIGASGMDWAAHDDSGQDKDLWLWTVQHCFNEAVELGGTIRKVAPVCCVLEEGARGDSG